MIELNIALKPSDYVQSQFLHFRPRPVWAIVGTLLLLLLLWAIYHTWQEAIETGEYSISFWIFIGFIIYLIGYFFVFIPLQARRIFKQQKAFHIPFTIFFNDNGIDSKSDLGDVNIPWSHIIRWKENDKLFLLYHSDVIFQFIPKRLIAEEDTVNKLRSLFSAKVGKAT